MSIAIGWLDFVIVVVVLLSTAFAVWRGFVSETLSIVAWAAGAFATLYFGPWFARFISTLISPPWLASVAGYGFIFLAVVIPLSFVSYRFAEDVKRSPVSGLDRALGGAFGVVRGLAIVGLAYILFSAITPLANHPRWVKEAAFLPLVQSSAEVLLSLVPDQGINIGQFDPQPAKARASAPAKDPIAAKIQETQPISTKAATEKPKVLPKIKPVTGSNAAVQKKGSKSYGATDRQALDKLIEATGKSGK